MYWRTLIIPRRRIQEAFDGKSFIIVITSFGPVKSSNSKLDYGEIMESTINDWITDKEGIHNEISYKTAFTSEKSLINRSLSSDLEIRKTLGANIIIWGESGETDTVTHEIGLRLFVDVYNPSISADPLVIEGFIVPLGKDQEGNGNTVREEIKKKAEILTCNTTTNSSRSNCCPGHLDFHIRSAKFRSLS